MRKLKGMSVLAAALLMSLSAAALAKKRAVPRKAHKVTGVVNINDAPVKKLMLLPYVGKRRAQAIVKYRTRNRFRQPSDIMKVKGIGRRAFKRFRSHVRVSGPTTIRKKRSARKRKRSRRK